MKKVIMGLIAMSILFCGVHLSLASDKQVVVIPLFKSNRFQDVNHTYSIPGTSFLPLSSASSDAVTRIDPRGLVLVGTNNGPYGVAHNNDGGKMSFTAPVHLPDGASIGHIGAALCSEDENIADHYISAKLIRTDMSNGWEDAIRQHDISSTDCGTLQSNSNIIGIETVDNSKYTYEFKVEGLEGGECISEMFQVDCDDRRTRLEYAIINYVTNELIK